jgi:hypothetical protein
MAWFARSRDEERKVAALSLTGVVALGCVGVVLVAETVGVVASWLR